MEPPDKAGKGDSNCKSSMTSKELKCLMEIPMGPFQKK
jgi:hypothetical protein